MKNVNGDASIRAGAGSIVLSQKTGRLLLGRRAFWISEPGSWNMWGGSIEPGSDSLRTAADELYEESGYGGRVRFESLLYYESVEKPFHYQNYLAIVDEEYQPWECRETVSWQWFELEDVLSPLHFGVEALFADPESMSKITDFVRRAKLGEDLLAGVGFPERTLYYCLHQEQGSILDAASCLSKAAALVFSHCASEHIVCNGAIDGTPDEFVLISNAPEALTIGMVRGYSFPGGGFDQVADESGRQYISRQPVAFEDARVLFETDNVETLMKCGLQIFTTEKSMDDLRRDGFMEALRNRHCCVGNFLMNIVRTGDFVWENADRGIRVTPLLQRQFYRQGMGDAALPRGHHFSI